MTRFAFVAIMAVCHTTTYLSFNPRRATLCTNASSVASWIPLISGNEEIKHARNRLLMRILDEKNVRTSVRTMYK
jgi:hypothetical protein